MNGLDKEMSLAEIQATPGWKRSVELDEYVDGEPEREIERWYDWVESQDAEDNEHDTIEDHYELIEPTQHQNHKVRPLTEQLIAAVRLDVWPSMATVIDFGIDSDQHLGALQFAIKYGEVTPEELDAAMGNGAKLTEIAQRGNNPYRDVTFRTSWDKMRLEPLDQPSGQDNSGLFVGAVSEQSATTMHIQFERILHGTNERSGKDAVSQTHEKTKGEERER